MASAARAAFCPRLRRPLLRALCNACTRIALCAAVLLLGACGDGAQRQQLGGATMGTSWSLVYADSGAVDPGELQGALEAELLAINQALSTYLRDSEISRVNRADSPGPMELSGRFATVLDAALAITVASRGAYDVTVGPLVELWGFGSASRPLDRVPAPAEIAAARARVGAGRLSWDPRRRLLTRPPGMALDLSSIAKGYAVDRLAELVHDRGIDSFLVEIGGELRAVGERPGGGQWRLAIQSPRPATSRVLEALSVSDAAVATSGDYLNYFEVDGVRYSHLVDPRTGYPVAHELVSVTVVHPSCMMADAWATALIVMGREAALGVAREQGLAVYLVARDGEELAVDYTDEFSTYLQDGGGAGGAPSP